VTWFFLLTSAHVAAFQGACTEPNRDSLIPFGQRSHRLRGPPGESSVLAAACPAT